MNYLPRLTGSVLLAGSLALLGCTGSVSPGAALATGERGVTAIASDDFFLYWSKGDGSVKRVSLDGGAVQTIATGQHEATHIAVDGTHVYWSSGDGTLARAPKSGGSAEMIAQPGGVRALAVDDTHVYFTTAGALQKAPKAGGDAVVLASDQANPGSLALSSGSVFWTNAGLGSTAGAVMEIPVQGGTPAPLVASQDQPSAIALSSESVFWINFGEGTLATALLDGTSEHVVVEGEPKLAAVVGDSSNVYFATLDGAVSAAPIQGGGADPTPIAQGPAGVVSLAMDATSIYWANSEDGAVMMMPKP
jgi:hypothetical protein